MRPRLAPPIVCLVTDRHVAGEAELVDVIVEAAVGGVNLVQLREKDLPTRELLDLASRICTALEPLGVPLIVNGRADVAFAAAAAGVHLPADGLPIGGARAALGDRFLVGRSIHSAEEAAISRAAPLDYLVLGTIFPSPSHAAGPTIGLDELRAAADGNVPVIAIGGITSANASAVMEAGADGVAVITAILGHPDPQRRARDLCEAVNGPWERRKVPSPASRFRAVPSSSIAVGEEQ